MHNSLNIVRSLMLLCSLTFLTSGFAQRYGNEWIVNGQTYYKIPVAETGFYRLNKSVLDQIGVPTATIGRGQYQIWRRGREIPLLVPGTITSIPLNNNEFLEFYAEKNDGKLDSLLYLRPEYQPHKFYSLHNDTAAYFLTWLPTGQTGKRMEVYAENRTNINAINWHKATQLQVFTDLYSKGKGYLNETGSGLYHSWFDVGEGWFSDEITSAGNTVFTRTITGLTNVSNQLPTQLEVMVVGRNGLQHKAQLLVGPNANSLVHLDSIRWRGFGHRTLSGIIPANLISNGTLTVRVRILNPVSFPVDRYSIAYIKLTHAQTVDYNGALQDRQLEVAAGLGDYTKLAILNPNANLRVFDVEDIFRTRFLPNLGGSGQYLFSVNGANGGRRVWANALPTILNATSIRRVQFRNINPQQHDFIIISHRAMMRPALGVDNPVRAYADYRASAAGGRYDTIVVEQDLVTNQFGYGDESPLSTRQFADFMLQGRAKYLMLLGKARQVEDRRLADYRATNLVYTFGVPGSDIMLTAGLRGTRVEPALATGRLSTITPNQIVIYLNKLREHEAAGYNELWRKNALVLTGGKLGETEAFKQYGTNYQRALEGRLWGANAKLITREDATTIIEAINITDKVNQGLSLITIFGHSSPAGADIDIGNATDAGFSNQGKYPAIVLNGCRAGNFYTTGSFVLADNWLYTPNKGCILFIGNVDEGLASNLDAYVTELIRLQFQDSATFIKPIGEVQQSLVRAVMSRQFADAIDSIQSDQFTIHGDPALKIFGAPKTDYKTSNAEVFLQDRNPTTVSPTLRVGIVVSNLGQFRNDSLTIRIRRTLADGRQFNYFTPKLAPVSYQDTIYYDLPKPEGNSGGTNVVNVTLNYYGLVDEIRTDNNDARLEFFLPESGLSTVFPPKYGVVGNAADVRLTAQSNNLLSSARDYYFECDTTIRFNSPIKLTATIRDFNLARTRISLPVRRDSLVYYWRVKFNDIQAPSDTTWYNSSFTYVNGQPEGWSQGSFDQFMQTTDVGIEKRYSSKQWDFPTTSVNIRVEAAGGNVRNGDSWRGSNVYLNGVNIFVGSDANFNCYPQRGFSGQVESRLITLVLDKNTLAFKPAVRDPLNDQRELCGRRPFPFNWYNETQTFNFVRWSNQLRGVDPNTNRPWMNDGDIMIVLNSGDFRWQNARLDAFNFTFYKRGLETFGIDSNAFFARNLNSYPFIGVGRKNAGIGTARTIYANPNSSIPPINQTLTLDTTFSVRSSSGTIESERIGPANRWQSLSYNFRVPAQSWYKVSVIGISLTGVETVLYDSVAGTSMNLAAIDPVQYPYLKLKALVNNIGGLPPQLKRWTVLYEGVPEGSINAQLSGQSQLTIGEKQEGEQINLKVAFQNISGRTFRDTIGVRVRVRNAVVGKEQFIRLPALPALAPNDTASIAIRNFSTVGWGGDNQISVFFNPQYQPEQLYTNNSIDIPFKVKVDRLNPLLDVTFDGVRLMDGDITSPRPSIAVVLRDDNRFLPKQDTTGIIITLGKQGSSDPPQRINFADGKARFSPATASSPMRVDYQPDALANGNYTLRVQAEDASGNKSGLSDYAINFKVVNESSVTNFYPYPNPFSTSTRFVFTLTGADVPDDIKIQIMTIAGRVVREITKDELGPIRIGNNITQFAWNGTDEFGDRLGNGVYLYRVILRKNGQALDHRATDADDTFKNGIGKLYLMR